MIDTTPADAEQLMLSCMLQSPDAAWDVFERLHARDFILPRHVTIGEAIYQLASKSHPTDPIAVTAQLESTGDLAKVGGAVYVHQLHGLAPTWRSASFYAEIVRGESMRRRMADTSLTLQALSKNTEVDPDVAVDAARRAIDEISSFDTTEPKDTFAELIVQVAAKIGTHDLGYDTPWERVTKTLGGLKPGAMYVLAARPGTGKSALALQMAVSLQHHGTVLFVSLEMSRTEIAQRVISQGSRLPFGLVQGDKALNDWEGYRRDAWLPMRPLHLQVEDRISTMSQIRAKVRTLARKGELTALVIDYLQLIAGDPTWAGNRVQQISEISRELKLIAMEFQIPVIAVSQMNRGIDGRADKAPILSDLRDSGSIEQDGDAVIFLQNADQDSANPDELYFIIEKHRQGPTGKITLNWEGHHIRAVDAQMLRNDGFEDEAMENDRRNDVA